jgi:hypothetical protein
MSDRATVARDVAVVPSARPPPEPEGLPVAPALELRIRVVGYMGQTARVLRDVITTVPQGRTALLVVPLGPGTVAL